LFSFASRKASGEYEGRPYFGPSLNLKDEDPEEARPQPKKRAHVRQFNLADRSHMEQYEAIAQAVAEGNVKISFEERIYDTDIKSWRVLIRWAELYMGTPKQIEQAEKEARR
jgi:hypothetical protein